MKEVIFKFKPQAHTRKATKLFLSLQEQRALMREAGDAALILFQYLLYRAQTGHTQHELTVTTLADALGWSEQKVKRTRTKLREAGWYLKRSFTYKGTKIILYYLGQDEVRRARNVGTPIPDNIMQFPSFVASSTE